MMTPYSLLIENIEGSTSIYFDLFDSLIFASLFFSTSAKILHTTYTRMNAYRSLTTLLQLSLISMVSANAYRFSTLKVALFMPMLGALKLPSVSASHIQNV